MEIQLSEILKVSSYNIYDIVKYSGCLKPRCLFKIKVCNTNLPVHPKVQPESSGTKKIFLILQQPVVFLLGNSSALQKCLEKLNLGK